MPLFGRHSETAHPPPPKTLDAPPPRSGFFGRRAAEPAPAPVVEQRRTSGGLFGRHHQQPVEPVPAPVENRRASGGFFGRHRSVSPSRSSSTLSSTGSSPRRHRSVLHGHHAEDPSIVAARERVYAAESAEREADKALLSARAAVRDARDHVKRLEREASEDARLAMLKQSQAKSISKRAKPLGRHGLN